MCVLCSMKVLKDSVYSAVWNVRASKITLSMVIPVTLGIVIPVTAWKLHSHFVRIPLAKPQPHGNT